MPALRTVAINLGREGLDVVLVERVEERFARKNVNGVGRASEGFAFAMNPARRTLVEDSVRPVLLSFSKYLPRSIE
jgi:flavin-dependent dehydrogenase